MSICAEIESHDVESVIYVEIHFQGKSYKFDEMTQGKLDGLSLLSSREALFSSVGLYNLLHICDS